MRDRSATEKGTEEPREANDRCFSPLGFEDRRVEFRTSKKPQDDCTRASQECYPLRIPGQAALRKTEEPGKEHANDQLGHRAHHNLRKRCRDLEPDRQQRRHQRKSHPERTKSSSVRHEHELLICRSGNRPGHNSATGFPVRSHQLSGLLEWTAVKGELPHLNIEKIVGLRGGKIK
jgi:hypothetical protein